MRQAALSAVPARRDHRFRAAKIRSIRSVTLKVDGARCSRHDRLVDAVRGVGPRRRGCSSVADQIIADLLRIAIALGYGPSPAGNLWQREPVRRRRRRVRIVRRVSTRHRSACRTPPAARRSSYRGRLYRVNGARRSAFQPTRVRQIIPLGEMAAMRGGSAVISITIQVNAEARCGERRYSAWCRHGAGGADRGERRGSRGRGRSWARSRRLNSHAIRWGDLGQSDACVENAFKLQN